MFPFLGQFWGNSQPLTPHLTFFYAFTAKMEKREVDISATFQSRARNSTTHSVRRSVGLSVGPSRLAFLVFTGGFGVTAPAQLLGWSISSLPLPTRTQLG